MCQRTSYTRKATDFGIGFIDGDSYVISCQRYDSGVVLFSFRKWDGSESTVSLGANNRYRCSCKGHLLGRKTCRHIRYTITHGMEIDERETVEDVNETADERDYYYAMQTGG